SAVFKHAEGVARANASGMLRLDDGFASHAVWQQGLEEDLGATIAHLDTLLNGFKALRERIQVDEQAAEALEEQLLEVRGVANRVEAAMLAFRSALRGDGDPREMVRWIEFRGAPRSGGGGGEEREGNVVIAAAPLDL